MKKAIFSAAVLLWWSAAMAGDFDGSKPLICAPVEVVDCSPGFACERGTPETMGAPAFMRIDFKKKIISGEQRTSPIRFIEKKNQQLLLQGTELGFAWTMALDPEGKMTVSLIDRSSVFLLFGTCTTY